MAKLVDVPMPQARLQAAEKYLLTLSGSIGVPIGVVDTNPCPTSRQAAIPASS